MGLCSVHDASEPFWLQSLRHVRLAILFLNESRMLERAVALNQGFGCDCSASVGGRWDVLFRSEVSWLGGDVPLSGIDLNV